MRAQFRGVLTLALMVAVCALLYVLLYGQISDHSIGYFQKLQLAPRGGHLCETNCPCKNTTGDVFTAGSGSAHKETPMLRLQKKDFKQYPIWASEDVYVRDKQKRQMTCPQSLRNSQNTGFKQAFIPDIQMYLHGELLNVSEWNRLAYFNNPFGFMDYTNYTEIKAVVDLIPKPREPLLLPRGNPGCIRCAVVATGGILNGSRMGKEIDAHDYVFRMNGAVTNGYEEDVGNRTSVYVHTAHSITQSLLIFKKYGYNSAPHDKGIKYVLIPEGLRDFQWLKGLLGRTTVSDGPYRNRRPWMQYSGEFDENRFYVLHPDFLRYARNRFMWSQALKGSYWAICRPTNGAFTLFLALHTCDVVDAYGFITEDHSKYPNYYAERHSKTRVIFYANHDYNLEIKTWKKLHDTKIIRLYQRQESPERKTGKPTEP
ncbi:alpha-N-acetylgalactosaminide alpha-2,6-sialyltransferase 1-like [Oncorhynchus kisutch]|uniref:alpha-N-acetylgalactosaminide alpha-2,6-sialyltransferase n=1 Tax=Oncorhynchus kisutch TaxID=8019 RepID=A0A8C7I1F9_ONCKI|nr:alpha-N-acetylgalactosaminide alpha-2,6-sialyltransferase 1-like [Oncorhynchus kisutch]